MKAEERSPELVACDEAFEVHAALVHTEAMRPALRNNPLWRLHRQDAAEDFARAWGKAT